MLKDKKNWLIAGLVLYILAKAFVSYTPSKQDDEIPDRLKDIVLQYVENGTKAEA